MVSNKLIANIAQLLELCKTKKEILNILKKIGSKIKTEEAKRLSKLNLAQQELSNLHESNSFNNKELTIILNEFASSQAERDNDQQRADTIIQEIKNEIEQYNLELYAHSIFYISETQIQLTLDDYLEELNISHISEYFNESYNNIATYPSEAVISAAKLLEAILKYYIKEADIKNKPPNYNDIPLNTLINITKADLGIKDKDDPFSVGIINALDSIRQIRNSNSHGQLKIKDTPLTPIQSRLIVNAIHSVVIFILETLKSKTI